MQKILKLWTVDLRQSWRDPITAMVIFVPVIIGLAGRFGFPVLASLLPGELDLTLYVNLVLSVLVLMPGLLSGMVAAFLMLDEKDEGTLVAIQVTPVPKMHYAVYRLLSPVLITALLVVLLIVIIGLVTVNGSVLVLTAILASLGAPLWAYAIFLLSGNKIEGLAMAKLLNLFICVPLLSLWLPPRLVPILWAFPLYWPYHFFFSYLQGAALFSLLGIWGAGMLVNAAYLLVLLRLMARRSYR